MKIILIVVTVLGFTKFSLSAPTNITSQCGNTIHVDASPDLSNNTSNHTDVINNGNVNILLKDRCDLNSDGPCQFKSDIQEAEEILKFLKMHFSENEEIDPQNEKIDNQNNEVANQDDEVDNQDEEIIKPKRSILRSNSKSNTISSTKPENSSILVFSEKPNSNGIAVEKSRKSEENLVRDESNLLDSHYDREVNDDKSNGSNHSLIEDKSDTKKSIYDFYLPSIDVSFEKNLYRLFDNELNDEKLLELIRNMKIEGEDLLSETPHLYRIESTLSTTENFEPSGSTTSHSKSNELFMEATESFSVVKPLTAKYPSEPSKAIDIPQPKNLDNTTSSENTTTEFKISTTKKFKIETTTTEVEADTASSPITSDITSNPITSDRSSSLNTAEASLNPNTADTTTSPHTTDATSSPHTTDATSSRVTTDATSSSNTADTTSNTIISDTTSRPITSDITSSPIVSYTTSTLTSITFDTGSSPIIPDTTSTANTNDVTSSPSTADTSSNPIISDTTSSAIISDTTLSSITSDTTLSPNTVDTTSNPITSDTTSSPVPSDTTSSPVPSDTTSSPVTSDTTSSPVTSDITSSPVTSDITSSPIPYYTSSSPILNNITSNPIISDIASTSITAEVTSRSISTNKEAIDNVNESLHPIVITTENSKETQNQKQEESFEQRPCEPFISPETKTNLLHVTPDPKFSVELKNSSTDISNFSTSTPSPFSESLDLKPEISNSERTFLLQKQYECTDLSNPDNSRKSKRSQNYKWILKKPNKHDSYSKLKCRKYKKC